MEWGPLRDPGHVAWCRACVPRGHDTDIRSSLDRTSDKDACQPALRVGERQELGWAATFLASPYGRFISGTPLVVDAPTGCAGHDQPPVVTVRDQMGRDPFEP
ncbi:MAG: hypothetical protein OXC00_04780 [Acidimicrobiaceae bacterium]|nr:hypothetical protein [Acidimicrobiaceae bacterium]